MNKRNYEQFQFPSSAAVNRCAQRHVVSPKGTGVPARVFVFLIEVNLKFCGCLFRRHVVGTCRKWR